MPRPILTPGPSNATPLSSQVKRGFDILGACGGLLFFLPMLVIAAVLIRLDSRGPALIRQTCSGLNGHAFDIYRFRTTLVEDGADGRRGFGGGRVTRLGAALRRSGLDELPQLLNIIKGDMSLVGPQPHPFADDDYYAPLLPDYRDRGRARPGLTGLAQVSGLRGDIEDLDLMRKRIGFDLAYIGNWSFMLDMQVIVRTARRVLIEKVD